MADKEAMLKNTVNKFNLIREEIIKKGWLNIVQEYHPSFNAKSTQELFDLYEVMYNLILDKTYLDYEINKDEIRKVLGG